MLLCTGPWESGGTATFPGHEFALTKPGQPENIICRFRVVKGTSVYYYDPFTQASDVDPASCVDEHLQVDILPSLDDLPHSDRQKYNAQKDNISFGALYKNFTGGSEWLTMYPKDPPRHHIHRADYFGQEHHIDTRQTHFHTIPPEEALQPMASAQMRRDTEDNMVSFAEYRAPGTLNLTVKALSCAPRAFQVENFLTDVEADHILGLVQKKNDMQRSSTNGHISETRTSSTTWLARHSDPVIDSIFRRVADTLKMDEAMLRDRQPGELAGMTTDRRINEDLQIVHYGVGQQYTAHHDFGYPKGDPGSPSRSINFCMYLNDVPAGGQTSFPRWRNAETNGALNVVPKKGTAMIFYMVNPDGNLDDLTHHAALPVIEGEKFFSNLWIWDPVRL